jgi:hypothetical protein
MAKTQRKPKHTNVLKGLGPDDINILKEMLGFTDTSLRKHAAAVAKQQRQMARWLGVTVAELEADSEVLYDHGEALLDVEAAYRKGANAGRTALFSALTRYFKNGYESGTADSSMAGR